MNMDLPAIASSTYAASAVNLAAVNAGGGGFGGANGGAGNALNLAGQVRRLQVDQFPSAPINIKENVQMATRRLVQVFIADPNENVPLEESLLYSGEQKLTDATDQELFFEIDIKGVLDKHNAKRAKMVDKKVKERTEYLEPAKIRDLKMVVVNVAAF